MSVPKFKIPEIRMPSDEELRKSSLKWFDRVGPTLSSYVEFAKRS